MPEAKRRRWPGLALVLAALSPIGTAAAESVSPERPREDVVALTSPALRLAAPEHTPLLAAARAGDALVVGGERGAILRSTDGGHHWRQAEVPVGATITAIAFADAEHGFAVGHFGVVLATNDGGATWSLVLDGYRAGEIAQAAVSDDWPPAVQRRARRLAEQGADKPFLALDLAADRVTVYGAFSMAFESADGGRSWRYLARELDASDEAHPYGVARLGDNLYLAGELGLLMRRRAGEAGFTTLPSPYEGSFFGLIAAGDGGLFAYGLRGHAFRGDDGGEHWQAAETGTDATIDAAIRRADGSLAAVTANGRLLLSRDGGRHFTALPRRLAMLATGLVETAAGDLLITGLGGLVLVPRADLEGGGS